MTARTERHIKSIRGSDPDASLRELPHQAAGEGRRGMPREGTA